MAVTPVGNPFVESSDLLANYPGASEALAERIDVVGVNPFADSAARDTAIPSPVEGQMASLNDDDKVYRYDGAAWQALGGLVHILTSTFTATSEAVMASVFSADYDNYLVLVSGVGSTSAYLRVRLRVGASDNTTSNYHYQLVRGFSTSSSGIQQTSQTSWDNLIGSYLSTIGTLNIVNPFAASNTYATFQGGESALTMASSCDFRAATSFDGINFIRTTGTFTGTISIYGYPKG